MIAHGTKEQQAKPLTRPGALRARFLREKPGLHGPHGALRSHLRIFPGRRERRCPPMPTMRPQTPAKRLLGEEPQCKSVFSRKKSALFLPGPRRNPTTKATAGVSRETSVRPQPKREAKPTKLADNARARYPDAPWGGRQVRIERPTALPPPASTPRNATTWARGAEGASAGEPQNGRRIEGRPPRMFHVKHPCVHLRSKSRSRHINRRKGARGEKERRTALNAFDAPRCARPRAVPPQARSQTRRDAAPRTRASPPPLPSPRHRMRLQA